MMKHSAGIIPYKFVDNDIYVYLERPGGPFWKGKDKWSVVKGEYTTEKPIEAARREFLEESGFDIQEELFYLGTFKLKRKLLVMFTVNKDLDVSKMKSNTFKREFNGKLMEFNEMDEAKWFLIEEAYSYIFDRQVHILDKLKEYVLK